MVCISKDSLCIWPRGEKTVCFCPVSSEFICQWIYGLEGLPRGRRVKTSREEIWEKHVWFTFVNEWTCLLALFGQIFKNTNISWIQFSFYQYIKCLNLWSTNVNYKKNTCAFSLQTLLVFLWEYCILCKILCCKNIWILSANIY